MAIPTSELQKIAASVTGIDLDEKALGEAVSEGRIQQENANLQDITVYAKDKDNAEKFDVVTIFLIDGTVSSQQEIADAVFSLLKPGGVCITTSEINAPMSENFSKIFKGRLVSRSTLSTPSTQETFQLYTLMK